MNTESRKPNNVLRTIVNLLSLLLICVGVFVLVNKFILKNDIKIGEVATKSTPEPPKQDELKDRTMKLDLAGQELTKELKRKGFNMGFVWSGLSKDLGYTLPVTVVEQYKQVSNDEFKKSGIPEPLEQIVPAPSSPNKRNTLIWEKYKIDTPIVYADWTDVFDKDDSGKILFDKFVDNNPIDSPVQKKLREGIVHLPFTPAPGEVGNSYIVGHSSNYSSVESKYNFVFKEIIEKVSNGEDFVIFDNNGRELKFKVINTIVVKEEDVAKAYVKYDNKRTVTLQGSILENGKPTKRYLVVGELQTDKNKDEKTSDKMINIDSSEAKSVENLEKSTNTNPETNN
jgi:LPXTG-site transpeptidase (sortase) family protein